MTPPGGAANAGDNTHPSLVHSLHEAISARRPRASCAAAKAESLPRRWDPVPQRDLPQNWGMGGPRLTKRTPALPHNPGVVTPHRRPEGEGVSLGTSAIVKIEPVTQITSSGR